MVDVDICVSNHLKEELAWAVHKRLRVICTIMLFKNSKSTKKLKLNETKDFKFKSILYTLLCDP